MLSDMLSMGEYGHFVWTAYGIGGFILTLNVWLGIRVRLTTNKKLKRYTAREAHENNS